MMLPENSKIADNEDFYASVYHHLINFEFFKAYKEIKEDPVSRFSGFFENDMSLSKLAASQADDYKDANEIITNAFYRHIDDEYYSDNEIQIEVDKIINEVILHANSGHLIETNEKAAEYFLKQIKSFNNLPETQNEWLTSMLAARNSGNAIDSILSVANEFDNHDPDETPHYISYIAKYVLREANLITAVDDPYEDPVHFDEKLEQLKLERSVEKQQVEGDWTSVIDNIKNNIDINLENYLSFANKNNKQEDSDRAENETWYRVNADLKQFNGIIFHPEQAEESMREEGIKYIHSVRERLGEHSALNEELQPIFAARECLNDTKKLISELSTFEGAISSYEIALEVGFETKTLLDLHEKVLEKQDIFKHINHELDHYGTEYSISNELRNDAIKLSNHATAICSHVIYDENKKPVAEQGLRPVREAPVSVKIKLK